ncbi:hypothetical protein DFH07DRAFT_993014 [Mycena maculata]|uniref:Uncharacterized protein n=1 Tax=Mycena maculata TaxID=230809 RepID=A0AAD7MSE7_9AGAR|nr:hypothetical protein DFH07DRAFT_993014 [Mycena maculata]
MGHRISSALAEVRGSPRCKPTTRQVGYTSVVRDPVVIGSPYLQGISPAAVRNLLPASKIPRLDGSVFSDHPRVDESILLYLQPRNVSKYVARPADTIISHTTSAPASRREMAVQYLGSHIIYLRPTYDRKTPAEVGYDSSDTPFLLAPDLSGDLAPTASSGPCSRASPAPLATRRQSVSPPSRLLRRLAGKLKADGCAPRYDSVPFPDVGSGLGAPFVPGGPIPRSRSGHIIFTWYFVCGSAVGRAAPDMYPASGQNIPQGSIYPMLANRRVATEPRSYRRWGISGTCAAIVRHIGLYI